MTAKRASDQPGRHRSPLAFRSGGLVRVQRRRTAGWQMPSGAVYVGRPTRWGNPFTAGEFGRAEAVARYRAALLADPARLALARAELAGRDLACWCRLDVPCHADVLLDLANTLATTPTGGAR